MLKFRTIKIQYKIFLFYRHVCFSTFLIKIIKNKLFIAIFCKMSNDITKRVSTVQHIYLIGTCKLLDKNYFTILKYIMKNAEKSKTFRLIYI